MSAILEISDVTKSFGKNLVLAGIDLEIAAHDVVATIGPSGSGKSTLLKCVNFLSRTIAAQSCLVVSLLVTAKFVASGA